ncbi:hypothetical protein [Candidatus Leptofilum sp.]|uniref:hypothetical protein n=1 Tax=Candidatus Leptofilum sp. TaxID=3241576 RepID=UPI003B5B318C
MMQVTTRMTTQMQTVKARIQTKWDEKVVATAVLLFLVFITGFAVVQYATPGLAGNDGYYHMKMGYLIRTEGLTPDFPYLPYTILNEAAYYDHHLLYHLFLAIFATTDPALDGGLALTQGAKLGSIIMPSLAFLAIWWLLRGQKVPYAAVWAVGLFAVSEAFLYRMSMPRAQSLSLLLLVLGLHWLLQGKYKLLLPLGFVFVWAYNAFPLLLVVAGTYAIAAFMLERRIAWQAIVYPAVGIGLGLIINPYFPQNIEFIVGHLLPKVGESSTPVGNEWSPYRTWTLVTNSGVAFTAVLAGILALGWREKRIDGPTLVALGLMVLFGYMLFESRRFVEYFPPFALIFFALSAAPILREWLEKWGEKRPYLHQLAPLILLLLLAYPLYVTLNDARGLLADSKPADRYADATIWLHDNTPAGTMVFQTDWDDFTRLFFYNTNAIYTAGLDPTFMELEDEALFNRWVDITRGRVEQPGAAIRDEFGAAYVFSDLNHDNFMEEAEDDPLLHELYRDAYAVIYRVGEQ